MRGHRLPSRYHARRLAGSSSDRDSRASDGGAGVSCLFSYSPPTNLSAPYYELPVSCGPYADSLRVLTNATSVSLRIFYDATFLEAYFEGGRVAITAVASLAGSPAIALTSTAPTMRVANATLYPMRSIWTEPEAVRKQPRVYN